PAEHAAHRDDLPVRLTHGGSRIADPPEKEVGRLLAVSGKGRVEVPWGGLCARRQDCCNKQGSDHCSDHADDAPKGPSRAHPLPLTPLPGPGVHANLPPDPQGSKPSPKTGRPGALNGPMALGAISRDRTNDDAAPPCSESACTQAESEESG